MEKNRIENINLHDLVENQDNPRSIEPQQMQKLVESILTFPKMLQMRPIVCNENRVILGGNMRFRALLNIEQMEDEAIKGAIEAVAVKLTDGEKQQLCIHWKDWKAEPQVEVVMADSLSDEETDEFIIKDNVYFGSWDEEKLKGAFDVDDMQRWGLNPWEIQQEATTYETARGTLCTSTMERNFKIRIVCHKVITTNIERRKSTSGTACRLSHPYTARDGRSEKSRQR